MCNNGRLIGAYARVPVCVFTCVCLCLCACVCVLPVVCVGGGGGGANVSSYAKQSVSLQRSEFNTVREYRYMKMIYYY